MGLVRLFQKNCTTGIIRLVGYVEQLVFLPNGGKNVVHVAQYGMRKRWKGFVSEVGEAKIGEFEKVKIVVVAAFG